MKKNSMYWILAMLLVVSLVMVGCAGNEAPEATTEVVMAATEAAPTEPAETKPAFVPERYEPTLPPEPTVPETEPTEPVEEDDTYYEEDNDDTYYEEENDYTPAPTEAPAPAPTEAPAPVETTPPEIEAPAVSLDYGAAGSYGDSYAVSTYGCVVDYELNFDNAGYYFPLINSVDHYISNGGQSALNAAVAYEVDLTASGVGGAFYVNCCVYESNGNVYITILYG